MRFAKTLATLLVGATFAVTVAAGPVDSTKLVRRENLDDDVEADDDVWERYAAACGNTNAKRSNIYPRADPPPGHTRVEMTKSEIWDGIPLGLWSEGFVSCIGLVVTGKKKGSDQTARVLGHFVAAKSTLESQWSDFKGKVEGANLENIKGWLSLPHLDEGTVETWDKDMRELGEEIESELKDRMDKLVDEDAMKVVRHMVPSTTMSVDKDNNVFVNGGQVS